MPSKRKRTEVPGHGESTSEVEAKRKPYLPVVRSVEEVGARIDGMETRLADVIRESTTTITQVIHESTTAIVHEMRELRRDLLRIHKDVYRPPRVRLDDRGVIHARREREFHDKFFVMYNAQQRAHDNPEPAQDNPGESSGEIEKGDEQSGRDDKNDGNDDDMDG